MLAVGLFACSAPDMALRSRVTRLVDELGQEQSTRLFPQEYNNLLETFEHGEAIFRVQENLESADNFYRLALMKAEVLQAGVRDRKRRLAEEERQRLAEEAARIREEQLMREVAEAEVRLRAQELAAIEAESVNPVVQRRAAQKDVQSSRPLSYTVRRGETLPQIAGRAEIYNDSLLWPLIYRSNRDQIRDPKRLWPGQVLTIPRHFNRDDAVEARRYSGKSGVQ
ncbi:MAG: LysM peptidoglycan-binding domain-containing protein [Desulfuromonadales bacterium]